MADSCGWLGGEVVLSSTTHPPYHLTTSPLHHFTTQFFADHSHAVHQTLELPARDGPRRLRKPAVGRDVHPLRLVELDEGAAGRGEGAHRAIDDRQQRPGDRVAVAVDVAALAAAGERVRARDGDLGGRRGHLAEPAELVDETEPLRRGERRDTAV